MIQIRPFLNSDPPHIVSVWNAQPAAKHLARQMKVATFEHFVLAKPYFDREGILVAEEEGTVIGFIHAGFGPSQDNSDVDTTTGVICTVQAVPDRSTAEIYGQLLRAAETYVAARGAQRIVGGPVSPLVCFYHGLSSVGESPGVHAEDQLLQDTYRAAGYVEASRNLVLHRDLTAFRPPFDRQQRALQRTYEVIVELDTDLSNWWELCRYGPLPRCGFRVIDRTTRAAVAELTWWDQAFTGAALQSTVSFTGVEVPPELRRQGIGTLLLNEAMKQLKSSGAFFASTKIDQTDEVGLSFFQSLGFREIAHGTTFRKDST